MIAFLGLGRMGTPMAGRLLAAGHPLVVWNRTPERTEPLVAKGAKAAPTPAEAVRGAEIVITMLPDPPAVESVLFGAAGAAEAMRTGACLIDMSTIGPSAVADLSARLPRGVFFVDAPVMGSTAHAAAGELTVLAGGAVERVEPVLEAFGTVVRCGEIGRGAALKVVLITAIVVGVTLVGEVLAVAHALGLSGEFAQARLAAGPLAGLVKRAQDQGSDFPIGLAAKDLGLAADAYRDARLVEAARGRLLHAVEQGAGSHDLSHVLDHIR